MLRDVARSYGRIFGYLHCDEVFYCTHPLIDDGFYYLKQ